MKPPISKNRFFFKSVIFSSLIFAGALSAQEKGLTNTEKSLFARLESINIGDVKLAQGFWADWFGVCRDSMVPHMMGNYLNPEVSHAFRNFEIAAGLEQGKHVGPPFHDGDFYKILEAEIRVYATTCDKNTEKEINRIIGVIGRAQRDDGYIHTPVSIKEQQNPDQKHEFAQRLDFETYNMGHLMTAACLHFRVTGDTSLLGIARKATDFLYNFYKRWPEKLAQNAICPSHYMGVTEMYRTTGDARYLELAKGLIDIRGLVENGTDDNQDRIPFRQQRKALGHAVRANYLYAGVADVFAETGDSSLLIPLKSAWEDVTCRKMYITGACGALYDGVSPDGTSYSPAEIQKVHQSYGREFQLPNLTAHNESCANIGNLLWNWRMLLITGDAAYADIMETVLYNSLLAGVSLNGKGYFYTNPLGVNNDLPYTLRWSKTREPYISYCNCCPPNTIRTIAEVQDYFYSLSDEGLWVNFYGGNELKTKLKGNSPLHLIQETDYPWDGKIKLILKDIPENYSLFLRIPGWAKQAKVTLNGKPGPNPVIPGTYLELRRNWESGDIIELLLPMEPVLEEANPLVEEIRNQVAVRRGPVVYCLESPGMPEGIRIFDLKIPADIKLKPIKTSIGNTKLVALEGEFQKEKPQNWENTLYREIPDEKPGKLKVRLIPYFAWDNRGASEMTVWIPLGR